MCDPNRLQSHFQPAPGHHQLQQAALANLAGRLHADADSWPMSTSSSTDTSTRTATAPNLSTSLNLLPPPQGAATAITAAVVEPAVADLDSCRRLANHTTNTPHTPPKDASTAMDTSHQHTKCIIAKHRLSTAGSGLGLHSKVSVLTGSSSGCCCTGSVSTASVTTAGGATAGSAAGIAPLVRLASCSLSVVFSCMRVASRSRSWRLSDSRLPSREDRSAICSFLRSRLRAAVTRFLARRRCLRRSSGSCGQSVTQSVSQPEMTTINHKCQMPHISVKHDWCDIMDGERNPEPPRPTQSSKINQDS